MTEKKICGLLIAETVKALQSTNAEMQLILLPLEVSAVSGHGERQYVALLPAGRGNAFPALKIQELTSKQLVYIYCYAGVRICLPYAL